MKQLLIIGLLFVGFTTWAQEENVFLDRSFWKENPNLETVKQKITEGNDATVFNSNAFDATVYALLEKADGEVVKHLLSLEGNLNRQKDPRQSYLFTLGSLCRTY